MIKDDDTIEVDTQEPPNIIFNYPLFHHVESPKEEFAIVSIFWVSTWEQYFTKGDDVPDDRKAMVQSVADRAGALQQIGIIHTGNFFTLRDTEDTPLIAGSLRFNGMNPIDIYMIEGEIADKKKLEFKMVTVH